MGKIEQASAKVNTLLANTQRRYAELMKRGKDNIDREVEVRQQLWDMADAEKAGLDNLDDESPEYAAAMAKLQDLQLKAQMSTETIAQYQAMLLDMGELSAEHAEQ